MKESERFSPSTVSNIATHIYQYIWEKEGKSTRIGINDERVRKILSASRKYEENYIQHHGTLKLLGMRQPMPLESLYITARLLDFNAACNLESTAALEEVDIRDRNHEHNNYNVLQVINERQYLMILGDPGSGKSTFLRWIGLEALKTKKRVFEHECIPVFIQLKGLTTREIDIKQTIIEEFSKCDFPQVEKFIDRALQEGKLLILLDGLDDIAINQMSQALSHLQTFMKQYDDNRFVASCRIATYRHNFFNFTDVVIADYNDNQIHNFIKYWFQAQPKVGQECWQKVKPIKELTKTPLTLSLICLLYERQGEFPTKRFTLYQTALKLVLTEWGGDKDLPQEEFYKKLDSEDKKKMLSIIAHDAFQENILYLPQPEITNKIEKYLEPVLGQSHIHGINILKSIEAQHRILVEREESIYSFFHLTIQEYLTAEYINTNHQIEKLVAEHLNDKRWREVFLFVVGLMGDKASDFVLLIEQTILKYINTPNLQALFCWAQAATNGTSPFHKVSDRANVLAIAIAIASANTKVNAISIALDKAYVIANTIACAIDNSNAVVIAEACDHVKINTTRIVRAINSAIENLNVNAYAFKKANTNAINTAISYAQQLQKLKIFSNVNFTAFIAKLETLQNSIPGEQDTMEVRREFVAGIKQTWLNALNLTSDMVNLSEEEAKALENYFYANYLIIQSEKAAVQVSPDTWKAIEEQMFLITTESNI